MDKSLTHTGAAKAKGSNEYSNGSLNVKMETEEATIIDVDLEEQPTVASSDAPDSTVSLEEGSGDEGKSRTGRSKRKAALNVRLLQLESDETDSDYSQEDGTKDPSFEPVAANGEVRKTGRRGRPRVSNNPTPSREAKVPKLQIRTDIAQVGQKSRNPTTFVSFLCEWGACDQQFEGLTECWDHIFNSHLRISCIPETETLRSPVRCDWKGCTRLKRCSLPFIKFSHLTRHVNEAHPLRSKPHDNRSSSMFSQ